MNTVVLGPEYIPNPTVGRPVANGSLYIGDPDTDPEIVGNQKQVYALQEDTTEVAITQPISLSAGGIPIVSGSPVTLKVSGNYSLKALDSLGVQVYYVPDANGMITTGTDPGDVPVLVDPGDGTGELPDSVLP